jgi:hypothetical protein
MCSILVVFRISKRNFREVPLLIVSKSARNDRINFNNNQRFTMASTAIKIIATVILVATFLVATRSSSSNSKVRMDITTACYIALPEAREHSLFDVEKSCCLFLVSFVDLLSLLPLISHSSRALHCIALRRCVVLFYHSSPLWKARPLLDSRNPTSSSRESRTRD